MTALSADRDTLHREGLDIEQKVAASAKVYAGSLVCINASGYAAPGADTAGFKFAGVAMAQADNSSGANGAINVVLRRKGIFRFAGSGFAITDIGKQVYISDDQTVALETTNRIACGRIVEFISATEVGVDIEVVPRGSEIISVPLPAFTANSTVNVGLYANKTGRTMRLKAINVGCVTVPADADGTMLLAVNNHDKSASADDNLLGAATFDMEGLTAKESTALTLTGTVADLLIEDGDFIFATLTHNAAAIDTNMAGGNITLELEPYFG